MELIRGTSGVYQVSVDGRVVAQRDRFGFPTDEDVVRAVAAAL